MKKLVLFFVCAAVLFWAFGSVNAAEYAGSNACFKCHPDQFNDWKVSGHPYKIQKAEIAKTWMLPLPKGYSWDDISYVIGGAHKKSRYMDKKGYIITMTGPNKDVPGKNQYNLETGTWTDYHPGEKNKKYDCGKCHTTGYKKEGHQDGLEGITGTWAAPGIHCEACHGPASDHAATGDKSKVKVDKSAALCGQCHIRGAKEKIPAKGGFIQHHEGFNEHFQSPHKDAVACSTCHNPHKRAKFSIKKDCATCHGKQAEAYAMYKGKKMHDVGIKCIDCHMPRATKSATAASKTQGDIRTHLFNINVDPKASMFYKEPKLDKEGKQVMGKDGKPEMAEFAKGFVTLDFVCLNCHKNKDMKWAAKMAKGIHK
mgnify:FL=1